MAETIKPKLEILRPFFERTATIEFSERNLFSACLRSSFTRSFEFLELASNGDAQNALFLVPALRGITEDIIYLAFLQGISDETRERAIQNIMLLDVNKRVEDQSHFFRTFRPFQPIFSTRVTNANKTKEN